MGDVLQQVQPYRERARKSRVFGDQQAATSDHVEEAKGYYEKALRDLNHMLALLAPELKSIEEQLKSIKDQEVDGVFLQERRHKLASQLADTYGMIGGIYRRMAEYDRSLLDAAIEMYDNGCSYELNPIYGLSDSYNMVNAIVLRILKDPLELERQNKKIQDAIEIIERQVKEERKYDWWAWADLGELCLLDGNEHEAFLAYEKLRPTGARVEDYDVIRMVLQDLARSLREINHPVVDIIAKAVQYLLNRSLGCFISYSYLDGEFAERLYKDLSSKGVKCWSAPYDLHENSDSLPSITKSGRENDKLILILSKHSLDSEMIKNEVEAAREKEGQQKQQVLFPVCLDDIAKQNLEPDPYVSHAEDFTRWKLQYEYQRSLEHLLSDLNVQ